MSNSLSVVCEQSSFRKLMPDLPLVGWMVLLSLVLGLAGGFGALKTIDTFNAGFGRSLGEFALILLPSFVLAAALSHQNIASEAAGRTAALVSPVAGAGMICPDTAYVALAPAAGRYKIVTALGAYTGFKLLYPAGPLIVAAGLGGTLFDEMQPFWLMVSGLVLALPVWAVGVVWAHFAIGGFGTRTDEKPQTGKARLWFIFAPFLIMASLLCAGGVIGQTGIGVVDFILLPKGALICAAFIALMQSPNTVRRDCIDSAVRRTGSLLLVIGAASAFGAVLTELVALDQLVPKGSGVEILLVLFALTVLFKLAQGSSMATFAAIGPVATPVVFASGIDPAAAVFAICIGSFISILPNDSYYWLVRKDALEEEGKEVRVIRVLVSTTIIQAGVGMAMLLGWALFWQ